MEQAACRHEDPELFFPVSMHGVAIATIAEAKAICHLCPVRGRCLEYALSVPAVDGIWGGMDEDERRTLLRRSRRGAQPHVP